MDSAWQFAVVFVLVCALIIVLAILRNTRLRANIKVSGAQFYIDTSRPGWKKSSEVEGDGRVSGRKPTKPVQRSYRRWLVAKVRKGPNWEYVLDGRRRVYIGSNPDNDILLQDPDADAQHALIYWDDARSRFRIRNLSHRGTTVNNRPIADQNLGDGNTIRMGRTELIFRQNLKKTEV